MTNQPKILCVTANPSIDRTMMIPTIGLGEVHRSYNVIVDAGGKGLNVARAVQNLGGRATCTGFTGGLSGQLLAQLATKEGLTSRWAEIDGETRTCVIVVPEDGSGATVFNENGPSVTEADWRTLTALILSLASDHNAVCLSGSLPAGSPAHALPSLIDALRQRRIPHFVDTSGAPLRAAIEARPFMIKVNQHEAGEVMGEAIHSATDAARVAQGIRQRGVERVIITLGKDGAVLVDGEGAWWAKTPPLPAVSAVASGDCFLAGVAVATTQGLSPRQALEAGVAAGTVNTLTVGGAHFTREAYAEVLAMIECTRVR